VRALWLAGSYRSFGVGPFGLIRRIILAVILHIALAFPLPNF
jgi:hypothetical protein